MPDSLPLRDTTRAYGVISRILHWSVAALILLQFTGMTAKLMLGRGSSVASFFVGLHQSVGSILFVLIVARVIWAITNRENRPEHGGGLLGLAARLGHLLLYAFMVLVPSAALIRAYGSERGFAPFGFEIFAPKNPEIGWTAAIGEWHGEMAWTMGALILGHIVMVGVHETMWRDGTLARMAAARRGGQTG